MHLSLSSIIQHTREREGNTQQQNARDPVDCDLQNKMSLGIRNSHFAIRGIGIADQDPTMAMLARTILALAHFGWPIGPLSHLHRTQGPTYGTAHCSLAAHLPLGVC